MPESDLKLTPELLVKAYSQAIFPMSVEGKIAWFSPDPRCIIDLDNFHASHTLMRTYKHGGFELKVDGDFETVIRACAETERKDTDEFGNVLVHRSSWISEEIIEAYSELHRLGLAHSVEAYLDGRLAGGLYGVSLGGAFMGESMFHWQTDASKVCVVFLVERLKQRGFTLLDCQYHTDHLARFGAEMISRDEYVRCLSHALALDCRFA
ncbi:MAG: leucyl/phenylalanyl-tRNA--protein transferase [Candidatus Obscuribacterales bacterium]|nr:leucyl/phenylalanyl-tRNA--protein transferase [Candidatus Obscuribacterales bacterium]